MRDPKAQTNLPIFLPHPELPGPTLRHFCSSGSHPAVILTIHTVTANQGIGDLVEQ